MKLHYCPQCGSKLQTGFKFCPSCGEKLPCDVDPTEAPQITPSPPEIAERSDQTDNGSSSSPSPLVRTPLRRTRQAFSKARSEEVLSSQEKPATLLSSTTTTQESPASGLKQRKRRASSKGKQGGEFDSPVTSLFSPEVSILDENPRVQASPQKLLATPNVKLEGEFNSVASPSCSPRSAAAAKSKPRRAKRACVLEPLPEAEQLTDTVGRKWTLVKVLSQSAAEFVYGAQQSVPGTSSTDYKHIVKLAAKEGKIFNEQNFLQRAAKSSSVDKWMKLKKLDFLGVPVCVGFGLHADTYRFLIFPNMGRTLRSLVDDRAVPLSQKAVLQIALRILDVLEYIHQNEYVHTDIRAENVHVNPANPTQVYLTGYCHAFRYCPNGTHVDYREGSRGPHEGDVEFISVESHKGAGPSRRSDLQALGYCMLHWETGSLPWTMLTDCPAKVASLKERYMTDVPGLLSHCFGKTKVPSSVEAYLSQVMSLEYAEKPDYQRLRDGLAVGLQTLGASLGQPVDLQV